MVSWHNPLNYCFIQQYFNEQQLANTKDKTMETVACDLCGSLKYTILFHQKDLVHNTTNEKFQIVRCMNCGLHYLNPRPKQNEMARYYSGEYPFHCDSKRLKKYVRDILHSFIQELFLGKSTFIRDMLVNVFILPVKYFSKIRKEFPNHLIPRIKSYIDIDNQQVLLDVGCGSGMSTHMYGSREAIVSLYHKGWDVYGTEPSGKARQLLHDLGLKNIYKDLFQAKFEDNFFDVIRMGWSLEHVHNPTAYLTECKRILKKDGKLIVGVPNYKGIVYNIFPTCVEVPVHLYYFCVDTFKGYCEKLDFTILDYYTFSYLPHFLKSIELMGHSSLHRYLIDNPVEAVKIQKFFNLMSFLDLGDDMVFCLSK